jgi:hypothetical protein
LQEVSLIILFLNHIFNNSGDVAAFSPNDVDGGLIQLFRIHLNVKDCAEQLDCMGSVKQVNCLSPSGEAFAVLWDSIGQESHIGL